MADDDSARPETAARTSGAASPRTGTAVQDGDEAPAENPESTTTTASLPTVGGPGDPYADPYVDRNGRATRGSTANPPIGPRSTVAAPSEGATGPTPTATVAPAPPAPGSPLPPASMAPLPPRSPSARPAPPSAVDQYAALGLVGAPVGAPAVAAPTPPPASSAVVPGAPLPPAAPPTATSTARRPRAQRTPRRARLQLRHFNVWTVFKFSVVLAVALFFVWLIIVAVLYGTLDHLQAIDKINETVRTIENDSSTNDAVTPRIVFTAAFLIGLVNIVLFIALTTIGAVVYNLCADLVGGIEVTLAERD